MDATYIQNSIEQLKSDIFMHVRHRTLLRYIDNPVINENQLFFLLLPFLNGENWNDKLYESIITVGIVQASLYEHEKINEKDATSKAQQLTVLSGDYYSGRYYEILAKSGNIQLIKEISEGIVKRSEYQIKIYEQQKLSLLQLLEIVSVIESELINKFLTVYHFDKYSTIMQTSLLILRLNEFIKLYKEGEISPLLKKMVDDLVEDEKVSFEWLMQNEIVTLVNSLHELLDTASIKAELKLYIKKQIAF